MENVLKTKINFFYLLCMAALMYVHNYNFAPYILTPGSRLSKGFSFGELAEFFLSNGFFRFRMGMIMAISGFLLSRPLKTDYFHFVILKAKTLIVPYFLVSLIGLLLTAAFEVMVYHFNPQASLMLGKSIFKMNITEMFYILIYSPIPYQLWYLKIVFILALFTPLIRIVMKHFGVQFLVILTSFWLFSNMLDGQTRDRCFVFFFYGFFLGVKKVDVLKPSKWFPPILAFMIFILFCVLRTYLATLPSTSFFTGERFLIFIYKIVEMSGVYAVWFGFDSLINFINKFDLMKKYGKSSFFIYAFHAPLINFIFIILQMNHLVINSSSHLIVYFLIPVLLLPLLVKSDLLVKTHFPIFYALLTGGRGVEFETRPIKIRQTVFNFIHEHSFARQ